MHMHPMNVYVDVFQLKKKTLKVTLVDWKNYLVQVHRVFSMCSLQWDAIINLQL